MTNPNKTLIAALLDRSGSMATSAEATRHGWHDLIVEQRGEPGLCEVTMAQFDNEYELVYPPTEIASIPDLILEPRGATALCDAVGRFITEVGAYLLGLPEGERPGRVICLIMTDGMENASREWNRQRVKGLINQQREIYNWEFMFLGANIDAVEVGAGMGIDPDRAMKYDSRDYAGNKAAYLASSALMKKLRLREEGGFTAADRDAAMGKSSEK